MAKILQQHLRLERSHCFNWITIFNEDSRITKRSSLDGKINWRFWRLSFDETRVTMKLVAWCMVELCFKYSNTIRTYWATRSHCFCLRLKRLWQLSFELSNYASATYLHRFPQSPITELYIFKCECGLKHFNIILVYVPF